MALSRGGGAGWAPQARRTAIVEQPPPPPPPPPPPSGTAMQAVAAGMRSGDWVTFRMGGLTFDLMDAGAPSGIQKSIIEFCARGHWDSVHKKIQFWGHGHLGTEKLITWDDATNQWSTEVTTTHGDFGHAYYHQALDPATGDTYLREYASRTVHKKTYATGVWSTIASIDPNGYANQDGCALEWLPGLNGGAGGLCFIDQVACQTWSPGTNSWTVIDDVLPTLLGNHHNWIAAAGGNIWFGGGNGSATMYKLTAAGRLTQSTDTPIGSAGIWPATNGLSPVISHPNGTDLLQFEGDSTGAIHRWNGTAWSSAGTHAINDVSWFAVPISDYGVVAFITQSTAYQTPVCRVFKP